MGLRSLIALVSLLSVSALAVVGCSKSAQKVQPETRGKRGETCLARNDCDTGLACLNGICAKNEFNVEVTAKQCTRVECAEDTDCCGDKQTEAPEKCTGRESICNEPTLPGCVTQSCVSETTCLGGAPCLGTCVGTGQTAGTTCETAADCPKVENTCVIPAGLTSGTCSATFTFCDSITPCTTLPATCSAKSCRCQNPDYMPASDICTDADCEDICLLRCQDSLCLEDKSCKTDAQCLALGLTKCDGGRCVDCTTNKDCDTKNDETCERGQCVKPCTQNEECGLFEACQKDGTCKYVGCESDKECILAASRNTQVTPGDGTAQAVSGSADDPRLYKCLPSETADYKTCKIPCENDGSCGQFQVCDGGYCKFVGCDSDEECRAYLGIANQMTSDNKPYIATAKCEKPPSDASTP
jgi:hypothetical protein